MGRCVDPQRLGWFALTVAGVVLALTVSLATHAGQDGLIRLNNRASDGNRKTVGDPFELIAVTRKGNLLVCKVEYSGGCAEHDFGRSWWNGFTESSPVGAIVRIVHDANGDACESLIRQTIRFELAPLKEAYQKGYATPSGKISIGVAGVVPEAGTPRTRSTAPTSQSLSDRTGDPQPVRKAAFNVLYEF